jgi:hypothetical protein
MVWFITSAGVLAGDAPGGGSGVRGEDDIHVCDMHVCDMHVCDMHVCDMHVCDMLHVMFGGKSDFLIQELITGHYKLFGRHYMPA